MLEAMEDADVGATPTEGDEAQEEDPVNVGDDEKVRLREKSVELEREADATTALQAFYSPAILAMSGVFVFVDRDGREQVREGYIAPEDQVLARAAIAKRTDPDDDRDDNDGEGNPNRSSRPDEMHARANRHSRIRCRQASQLARHYGWA